MIWWQCMYKVIVKPSYNTNFFLSSLGWKKYCVHSWWFWHILFCCNKYILLLFIRLECCCIIIYKNIFVYYYMCIQDGHTFTLVKNKNFIVLLHACCLLFCFMFVVSCCDIASVFGMLVGFWCLCVFFFVCWLTPYWDSLSYTLVHKEHTIVAIKLSKLQDATFSLTLNFIAIQKTFDKNVFKHVHYWPVASRLLNMR